MSFREVFLVLFVGVLAVSSSPASDKALPAAAEPAGPYAAWLQADRVTGTNLLMSAWAEEAFRQITPADAGALPDGAAPPPLRDRGGPDWVKVYDAVAPSVVFLGGAGGFGTGFLVGEDGWIVTNHHVARQATLDEQRHRVMNAYFGELKANGAMEPIEAPIPAVVHAWNAQKDLAILKLQGDASRWQGLKHLALVAEGAPKQPRAGGDIALVGNAAVGLLWAMKTGHISSIGTLAKNLPELVSRWNQAQGIQVSSGNPPGMTHQVEEEIVKAFASWIGGRTLLIQATAETSPGDSGGPLLNDEGEIVGVAMGLRSHAETGTNVSYYIHVDELRALLATVPEQAMVEIPRDIWSSNAVSYDLVDLSGDGVADGMRGFDSEGKLALLAVDADQSTDVAAALVEKRAEAAVLAVLALGSGQLVVYGDGTVVASDSDKKTLWRMQLPGRVSSAAMAADASLAVVGCLDGGVRAFNPSNGDALWSSGIDTTPIVSVALGDDGSIWAGSYRGTLAKLASTGALEKTVTLQNPVIEVACAGTTVLTAEYKGATRAHDARTLQPIWSNADVSAFGLRFDRDGRHVVASPQSDAQKLYWLDAQSGQLKRELALDGSPYAFEFAGSEERIAVHQLATDEFVLYDLTSGQIATRWQVPTTDAEARAKLVMSSNPQPPIKRFLFDGTHLVTGTMAGTLYDLQLASAKATPFTHDILTLDLESLVGAKKFDAELAWVKDPNLDSCYALYDMDDNGSVELVRVDDRSDGTLDSEFAIEGSLVRRIESDPAPSLFLGTDQVPPQWAAVYARFRGDGPN